MDNTERILDWVPRFDEKSRLYPIRGAVAAPTTYRKKLWTSGEILDQGREGACVGFGVTAEALATPVRVNLKSVAADVPREPNAFARFLYHEAQKIDEWEGEDYDGTSVLAGIKAIQKIGTIREYRWAFSIDDVIVALMKTGPVVLGIEWREDMYEAPGGVLRGTGRVVGGHCILATGFDPASPLLGGEPGIILQNSWGTSWGNNGRATIHVTDLADILSRNGEACAPTKRSYGYKLFGIFSI